MRRIRCLGWRSTSEKRCRLSVASCRLPDDGLARDCVVVPISQVWKEPDPSAGSGPARGTRALITNRRSLGRTEVLGRDDRCMASRATTQVSVQTKDAVPSASSGQALGTGIRAPAIDAGRRPALQDKRRAGGRASGFLFDVMKCYFISLRRMVPKAPTRPVPSKSNDDGSGTVWPVLPRTSKAPRVCVPFEVHSQLLPPPFWQPKLA